MQSKVFFQRRKISFLLEAVIVSLIVAFIIPFVFFLKAFFGHQPMLWDQLMLGVIFSFVVSFSIYFCNVGIIYKMQQAEKKFRSHFLRILLELLITCTIASIIMALVFMTFLKINSYSIYEHPNAIFDNIIIAIIVDVVCIFITEALFFFHKWKTSLIESEQLRRKNVEIQYAALASQVNPHFLFNSLNTLSSLIQADPERAVVFTREFSRIYRYVLDTRDKFIVTLQEELNFLYSFLYLQKIRFDKSLEYKIEVNASCLDLLLPPLTLQIVVENAIKHNEILEENPLHISITGSNSHLVVTNNYRPVNRRPAKSESGIGLKNLMERYSHYTDVKPEFKIENQEYIAIIPLLKDE